jgi:3-mercaptopyruvate sulfurtransferase SseA
MELKTQEQWSTYLKGLLKAELSRRDISYQQLASLLREMGIEESPENITNKINRGRFSAIFFVQCLQAIGCKSIRLIDE